MTILPTRIRSPSVSAWFVMRNVVHVGTVRGLAIADQVLTCEALYRDMPAADQIAVDAKRRVVSSTDDECFVTQVELPPDVWAGNHHQSRAC
jgi:hypothetical protein